MSEGGPQSILERGEAVETPPALLIQGTNDDNVTPDMAENFVRSYRAAGGEIALEVFPGQTHAFIAKDPDAPDAKRALGLIADFICALAHHLPVDLAFLWHIDDQVAHKLCLAAKSALVAQSLDLLVAFFRWPEFGQVRWVGLDLQFGEFTE